VQIFGVGHILILDFSFTFSDSILPFNLFLFISAKEKISHCGADDDNQNEHSGDKINLGLQSVWHKLSLAQLEKARQRDAFFEVLPKNKLIKYADKTKIVLKVDLIIRNARQLVTCAAGGKVKRGAEMQNVGIVADGALAVGDGAIVSVGKSNEIAENYQSENVINASGKVVCPAFVDPHTHIVFAGDRLDEFELKIKGADYLEILENGGGILSTVRQTREADLKSLVENARRRLDKMLAHGTGTAEIKTGYGLDAETELKMLAAIFALDKIHAVDLIPTFLPAHAFPPEYKGREDDYVDLICGEMLKRARLLHLLNTPDFEKHKNETIKKVEKLITSRESSGIGAFQTPDSELATIFENNPFFVDVFCERNAFSLEQSRRVLEAAKKLGFGLKAHVDEFTNLGGARMAIELGATSIDHLDAISDEEIKLLAASETVGVVTPTVNFNFGATHFADARKMIDANCVIAVSTDYNPGSSPCPSQPLAMAIACRYQKLLPSEALNAITINAAFAVGLGAAVGSLEVGKQADVLILDTDDYRQLAYEFGGNFVESVIKKGRVVA
jgi:imidazolonepropionase